MIFSFFLSLKPLCLLFLTMVVFAACGPSQRPETPTSRVEPTPAPVTTAEPEASRTIKTSEPPPPPRPVEPVEPTPAPVEATATPLETAPEPVKATATPIEAAPEPVEPAEARPAAFEGASEPLAVELVRYPGGRIHSPIAAPVIERVQEIRAAGQDQQADVFAKLGASAIADRRTLRCFSPRQSSLFRIELSEAEHLRETLEFFRGDRANRRSPFDRRSEAAEVGQSVGWVTRGGGDSPMRREFRQLDPAWAIISFGTNDLNQGTTPRTALFAFYRRYTRLVDEVIEADVVPILMSTWPRADTDEAVRWSPVFGLVIRAVAEANQVPFVDMHAATEALPNRGLISDGIHGNGWVDEDGRPQPCVFTPEALQYHYNVRNLVTLEALDRARRAASDPQTVSEAPPLPELEGDGSIEAPFVIDTLPFTHSADTEGSGGDEIDSYPACSEQDMSGPELVYQIELEEPRSVMALVLHPDGVDVDLALLGPEVEVGGCLRRDDRHLEGQLEAGTYHLIVDTYTNPAGRTAPGEYLLVVTDCPSGLEGCTDSLL